MPRQTKHLKSLQRLLESEVSKRDNLCELSLATPDPLMVAKTHNDEVIALVCALFSYGNAKAIVNFLHTLDFSLLDASKERIEKELSNHRYRFQTPQDITSLFIALGRLKKATTIEDIVFDGYSKRGDIFDGVSLLIEALYQIYPYSSSGYKFLIGKPYSKSSPFKRYMMYLRWMVRKDSLDMGLWTKIPISELIMPLDVHTFSVSQKLGLLARKSYDQKAAIELTNTLRKFDKNDPVKYDFALYRIGQQEIIKNFLPK